VSDSEARQALQRLRSVAANTVVERMGQLLGEGAVQLTADQLQTDGGRPFEGLTTPCWAVSLPYSGGVTGGNLLVLTDGGAKALAANLLGDDSLAHSPLGDLEGSAITEATNQTIAALASATGKIVQREIGISPPELHRADDPVVLERLRPADSDHALPIDLTILGHRCRLIQFIPRSFVLRALRGPEAVPAQTGTHGSVSGNSSGDAIARLLRGSTVRVWAEFGRCRMPLGELLSCGPGVTMCVDAKVDDPVNIYVNGTHFACGNLVVTQSGHWAVQVETLTQSREDLAA
jgi:flagellar motor switch protein FliN/FliY